MTTSTKLCKGVEVWMFGNWDNKATVYARRVVLQSLGKKQGTATSVSNGKFVKHQIWAADYCNLVAVADLPDPTAEGLRRATEQRRAKIESLRDIQHWYADTAQDSYHVAVKRDCQEVMDAEPKFFVQEAK